MDNKPSKGKGSSPTSSKKVTRRTPTKIFPNPYLTFLGEFRRSHKGKFTATELIREGAKLWRKLSDAEKQYYIKISKSAPKYKKTIVQNKTAKKRRNGYKINNKTLGKKDKIQKTKTGYRKQHKKFSPKESLENQIDFSGVGDSASYEECCSLVVPQDQIDEVTAMRLKKDYDNIRKSLN